MKVLISVLFLANILFAKCFPLPCSPEGSSGQSQVNGNISSIDSKIKKELDKKEKYLDEEKKLLEEITALQSEILNLARIKSVYVDKIIQEDSNVKEIIRIQK